jgi:O-antigen biosynthesis protein WbqV
LLRRRFRPTPRSLVALGHDVLMAALSVPVAMFLRVGGDTFAAYGENVLLAMALVTPVAAAVFLVMGLYRGIWRYASINDLLAIVRAATIVVLVLVPAMFFISRLEWVPRSFPVIHWFVLIFLLGAPRLLYRIARDGNLSNVLERNGGLRAPVLLVGATDAAESFIREMRRDPAAPFQVVGLLDDRPRSSGLDLHGQRVLGGIDAAQSVIDGLVKRGRKPQRFIIARRTLPPEDLSRILEIAEANGMTVASVPRLSALEGQGAGVAGRLAPIAVEDLLGRPRQVLDLEQPRQLIAGRRVLVTGAGGSIGGELVRQIAALGPAHLVLLDNSELALYEVDRRQRAASPELSVAAALCDVRDKARLDQVIAAERPDLVFHAAALKHVPIVEDHPCEGVLTNVIGTVNLADACRIHGVAAMVLISTDKAVEPASVLGASKRLAELCCQALDAAGNGHGTRFVTVRFGNVLASTGSVVPLFHKQLEAGGPLTVTHPEVTRFFMTIREAVELVLQAAALAGTMQPARGGVFVLDMGTPVKILDLARQMIRLAGKRPDVDVAIEFTGLRHGEKLREELYGPREQLAPTSLANVSLASGPRPADWQLLRNAMEELTQAARAGRDAQVVSILQRLVPEYAAAAAPPVAAAR